MCVLIIIIIQGIPVASLLDLVSLRGIKHAAVSRPRARRGVVTAGITKACSFPCINCGRSFKQKKNLAVHYGVKGTIRRQYDAGTPFAAEFQRPPRCKRYRAHLAQGKRPRRGVGRKGVRLVQRRPCRRTSGDTCHRSKENDSRGHTRCYGDERDGLASARVREGIVARQPLACVRLYVTDAAVQVST